MPTQQDIATHLGLNQSEVSRHMAALNLDWKKVGLHLKVAELLHLASVLRVSAIAAPRDAENGGPFRVRLGAAATTPLSAKFWATLAGYEVRPLAWSLSLMHYLGKTRRKLISRSRPGQARQPGFVQTSGQMLAVLPELLHLVLLQSRPGGALADALPVVASSSKPSRPAPGGG